MTQLYGEYECRLDPKGRLKVPSQLLKQLGGTGTHTFFMNKGFEQCIVMYPQRVWDQITEKIGKLNYYNTRERHLMRLFFKGVRDVTTDSVDRILLSKHLQEHAGIKSDVVLFAFVNKIEIWDRDTYYDKQDDYPEDFSELANQIIGASELGLNL